MEAEAHENEMLYAKWEWIVLTYRLKQISLAPFPPTIPISKDHT